MIIAGDINQLDVKTLTNHMSFVKLVKSATKGQRILDAFLTNVRTPFLEESQNGKSLVRSDHNMILAHPMEVVKAERRKFFFDTLYVRNR